MIDFNGQKVKKELNFELEITDEKIGSNNVICLKKMTFSSGEIQKSEWNFSKNKKDFG